MSLEGRKLKLIMRFIRTFGVMLLLLASSLAPATACIVTDSQMSAEERACCAMMKNHCGQMEMPASHGCCQKTPPGIRDGALATKKMAVRPVAVTAIRLTAAELLNPAIDTAGWIERTESSPPKSPPSTVSILRI